MIMRCIQHHLLTNGSVSPSLANIELCLEKVGVWMVENRLKMNYEKTEFIAFG